MNAIIVYYSLEGNTEFAAREIAVQLEAATLKIEPVTPYPDSNGAKYFWGGKDVIFGIRPQLKPYQFKADDYDTIIIGTPVWAGGCTPPICTFLAQNNLKGKKIGLFASSSSGNAEKCFEKMKRQIGIKENIPTASLREPAKTLSASDQQRIDNFCKKFMEAI